MGRILLRLLLLLFAVGIVAVVAFLLVYPREAPVTEPAGSEEAGETSATGTAVTDVPADAGPTYDNPVYHSDFPDPFVLRVDDTYYAYSTSSGSANIPIITSNDLVEWRYIGDALPALPPWVSLGVGVWAPAVLPTDAGYVLYYTPEVEELGRRCISRAVGDAPDGLYVDDSEEPLVCQTDLGGSIDPYAFVDVDGTPYLLWKNDGNCCGLPVKIWIQALSEDGLSLVGSPVELIERDQAWERPLIENPAMWQHEGNYYLFYSGNRWESHEYAVGYAVCEAITGPCEKPQAEPIFSFTPEVMGPGGETLFTDTENNLWMAYHAWTGPHVGYPAGLRSLRIDPVTFEAGEPVIHGPTDDPEPLP
jgi:beta-xylosidase